MEQPRKISAIIQLVSVFLKLPLPVVQRAHLSGLQPAGNTVEMESMVADTPGYSALLRGCRSLVGLALYTEIHDVVPTNSTVIHHNVPGPQRHSIPLVGNQITNKHYLTNTFTAGCLFDSDVDLTLRSTQ